MRTERVVGGARKQDKAMEVDTGQTGKVGRNKDRYKNHNIDRDK